MRYAALLLAFLLTGCIFGKHRSAQNNTNPAGPWGYYSGPIETRWETDGRTMTLMNELRYTDPKGVVWIAPAGSVIDGASIPRALWSFMGGPFEGRYRNASVLHDVAYDQKNKPPAVVDRMFYDAMRCSGVGAAEAKTMYYALLRFGRHWKFTVKKAKPVLPESSEVLTREPRTTTVDPNEVNAIQQWIRQNDPTLDQIESRADAKRR
jgi:endonuclease G